MATNVTRRDVLALLGGAVAVAPLVSRLSAAAKQARPNVLFIMTDDQRQDALSVYGNPVLETPHMDRIAAGGTRFTEAFVTHSLC